MKSDALIITPIFKFLGILRDLKKFSSEYAQGPFIFTLSMNLNPISTVSTEHDSIALK